MPAPVSPPVALDDRSWVTAAGALALLLGAVLATMLTEFLGALVLVVVALALPLMIVRLRTGWTYVPLLLVGSAVLLPLLTVAGRPADNYVALAVTAGAFIALLAARVCRGTPKLLMVGLAILSVTAVLSAFSNRPDDAVVALRFASYGVLAAALVRLDRRQMVIAQRAVLGLGLVLAASVYATYFGLVTLKLYADAEAEGFRVGGLIGHPNFAAYFLGLLLLAQLVLPGFRGPRWPVTATVFVGAILLTGSRGAVIWLVLAALCGFRHWWSKSPLLLGLAALALAAPGSVLIERFASLQASGGLTGQNAAGWRFGQWERALDLQDGMGATGLGWTRAQELLPAGLGVHNGYLQVFLELGLLGVLGLIIVIFALVRLGKGGKVPVAIMVFVLGTTIADPVLLYPPITYLLLVVLLTSKGDHRDDGGHAIPSPSTVSACPT